jgi:hypothetical protein
MRLRHLIYSATLKLYKRTFGLQWTNGGNKSEHRQQKADEGGILFPYDATREPRKSMYQPGRANLAGPAQAYLQQRN